MGFIHSGIIVYLTFFPPDLITKIVSFVFVVFLCIGIKTFSDKTFKDDVELEPVYGWLFLGMAAITVVFKIIGMICYIDSIANDNIETAQKESEFGYLANFIDSSLLLITLSQKGYLLNYVNDNFFSMFREYLDHIPLSEDS